MQYLLLFVTLFSCIQEVQVRTQYSAKVIGIKDGDTIEVLYEGKPLVIRLAHVDCPEIRKKQPFGQAAKKFTSDLCFAQTVTIQHENKYDRYKRLIAVIINEKDQNVNKELVRAGYAWHFKKYSSDLTYDVLEKEAKENRSGLWADVNAVAPWDWRKP